ncbi:hypothetical protein PUMCH_004568 [Australozyma saopauloensis]|uniref:RRM domain-containing protein n=1 Tax=Australozyma saopauloensis TaxID=291208 RepID=A0AAX4HF72_9ASCO|nr:hypothetical protein PUMCH_004568 [[Candida] saopauloensis]
MASVIVTNVDPTVSSAKVKELFSFCGKIEAVEQKKTGTFEVKFQLEKALETALLLNDAELESSVINVARADPPSYDSTSSVGNTGLDKKVQEENASEDDILQEDKPKLAVLAQLLASGYKISDDLIANAIKFDQERGISSLFMKFINDLDNKFLHTSNPESTASKNIELANNVLGDLSNKVTSFAYLRDVQNYIDKAAATPSGLRIHRFYKDVTKEIKDVHLEANRLYELKKGREDKTSTGAGAASSGAEVSSETSAVPLTEKKGL